VCLGLGDSGVGTVGCTGIEKVCVWVMVRVDMGQLVVLGWTGCVFWVWRQWSWDSCLYWDVEDECLGNVESGDGTIGCTWIDMVYVWCMVAVNMGDLVVLG
jgi:hypothetical protein